MPSIQVSHGLEREDFGDVTLVRLKTPNMLDETAIRELFDPIDKLVDLGRSRLAVNMKSVEYLPSLALGKLVLLNRKVQSSGGRLVLCELSATAGEVFDKTRLGLLFSIHSTEADALASFTP